MGKWVYQLDDNEYVCRNDPPFYECDDCHANKAPYCFGWCTDGGTSDSENYCIACCERRNLDVSELPKPTDAELAAEFPIRHAVSGPWSVIQEALRSVIDEGAFDQFDKGALLLDVIEGKGKTLSSGVRSGMDRVRSLCDDYVRLKEGN